MNAREQYLQKRVERLEALIAFLRADLDYTESVGAAFALDLGMLSDGDIDDATYEARQELCRICNRRWHDATESALKEALREDRG